MAIEYFHYKLTLATVCRWIHASTYQQYNFEIQATQHK